MAPPWLTPEVIARSGGVIQALVFDENARRRSSAHSVRVWSGPVPEKSFYEVGDGTFVASPEFMFLAAATVLSFVQLVAFGYELCGLYSFDDREERGFRKRAVPLTTTSTLKRYLAAAKGCRGYATAVSACRQVEDNSASPMETYDAMWLTLPYRLGGYCLRKPLMNHEVPLDPRAMRIAQRTKCFLDMGYIDPMLDIEHHGKHDHSSYEDRTSDRARVNALKEMGFEVIELTNDQVNDIIAFDYIVQRIAKILGKRIRKEHLGVTPARLALRKELRAWNRSGGRLA